MADGVQTNNSSRKTSRVIEHSEEISRKAAIRLDAACNKLSSENPLLSARYGLTPAQRSGLSALCGAALIFAIFIPAALNSAMVVFFSFCFSVQAILRFGAVGYYLTSKLKSSTEHPPKSNSDRSVVGTLPNFSILVPVYNEANIAAQSVKAMADLDYPKNSYEVFYLVEADDDATFDALERCRNLFEFKTITIPNAAPKTKPKALNFGLSQASGDIISVFDAEDIPDPQQLNIVAKAFQENSKKLAVVQAELRPYNHNSSWVASQFSLEYAIQFLVWMPFIARLGWPLNLGGTSNHFRAEHLRNVGAWDPYNVTEDADLGLRLAAQGYTAQMVDSYTLEEAPIHFGQWIRQRSRWIKGHLTTWLVHMRQSRNRLNRLGLFGYCGLQVTFALSLVSNFLHGPLLGWMIWRLVQNNFTNIHPAFLTVLSLSLTSVVAAALTAPVKMKKAIAVLTFPFYWPLLSLAALIAIWEMRVRPHAWSKTPHGLCAPPSSSQKENT